MPFNWFYIYLALMNFAGGIVFFLDKQAAVKGKERTPERTLHLLEMLGGGFAILLFMYIIRHKNRKPSYFLWTWASVAWWGILLIWAK